MSDVHAKYQTPIGRRDNIGEAFESKINFIFRYAKKHGAIILQAGDLNDKARNWEVLHFFVKSLLKYQIMMFCVYGQHDLYMRRDPDESPSVLSILMQTRLVFPLGNKPVQSNSGCSVYGSNWGDKIPTPNENSKRNILVLHAPISKKSEFPGHDYTSPQYFMRKHPGFDVVLVGDVHKKIYYRTGDRYLINTGPLLRVEATKYNMRHRPCFYVYDSNKNTIEKVVIPHTPAKEILFRDHIVQKNISTHELEQFAATIKKLPNVGDQRRKNVIKFIKENAGSKSILKLAKEVMDGRFDKIVRGQDQRI